MDTSAATNALQSVGSGLSAALASSGAWTVNWIDLGIVITLLVSAVLGIMRGFIKEALSLATWVVAVVLGLSYSSQAAGWFTFTTVPQVQLILGFLVIVLLGLIAGSLLATVLSRLVLVTGFGVTDRFLGMLFGLFRGAFGVSVALLVSQELMSSSFLQSSSIWSQSKLVPLFLAFGQHLQSLLPQDWWNQLTQLGGRPTSWSLPSGGSGV